MPYQRRFDPWKMLAQRSKGLTPTQAFALYRLQREQAGAPGSQTRRDMLSEMQQQLARQMSEAKFVMENFQAAYDTAPTPEGKEEVIQKQKLWAGGQPKYVQQAVEARYTQSPFSIREQRRRQMLRNRPEIKADPETAPALFAAQRFAQMKFDSMMSKELDGIEKPMPSLISVKEGIYAVRGENDSVNLISSQGKEDTFLQGIAKAADVPVEYIISTGGFGKPKEIPIQIVRNGETRQAIVTSRFNYLTQSHDMKLNDVGESPRGDRPFRLPPTEGEKASIEAAIVAASLNQRPDPKRVSAETSLLFDQIVEARKTYKNDPEGFKRWMRTTGSNFSPQYTFIMLGKGEKRQLIPGTDWFAKMDFGEDFQVLRVPGKVTVVPLADGTEAEVIASRYADAIFDIGTAELLGKGMDETLQRLSRMTTEEFETGESKMKELPSEEELQLYLESPEKFRLSQSGGKFRLKTEDVVEELRKRDRLLRNRH